jgi:ADP-dependent NAD(P)H-hydrate dehydratase / NAD(P)H-hydrate epimerase
VKTPLREEERREIAHRIAVENHLIVVLKGHRTLIASDDGEIFVDEIGGPELATAGSGDILAGLIGSFLVSLKEGGAAVDLVVRAVTLHSRAGKAAGERFTKVTSLEILDALRYL